MKMLRNGAIEAVKKQEGLRLSKKAKQELDGIMQKEVALFLKCAGFLAKQQGRQTVYEQDVKGAIGIWKMAAVPEYLQGLEGELKTWLEAKRQSLEAKQNFLGGEHSAAAAFVEKNS